MFCRNCGKEIPDQVRFCPACGYQLKQTSATPQQSVENPDQSISQQHVYNQSQVTSQTVMQQQGMIAQQTVNQKSGKREKVRKKWKTEAGIVTIIIGALLMIGGGAAIDVGLSIFIMGTTIVCCGIYHLLDVTDKVDGVTRIIGGSLTFLSGFFITDFQDFMLTIIFGSTLFFASGIIILACKNKKNAGETEFWLGASILFFFSFTHSSLSSEVSAVDRLAVDLIMTMMVINGAVKWNFWARKFKEEKMKK
ncbi:MAG: zinc ribbon domain-containing protein [Lachnospiraceae bacterium]|nr:zinc ribbon domain-containing protein [Lachnospiraceae bacterium]